MSLSDLAIRNLKATEKTYRKSDSAGLYLEVFPNGSKYWRMKYRYDGKEKRYAVGVYPAVPLAEARDIAQAAKRLLKQGLDPTTERKALKAANVSQSRDDLEGLVSDWLARQEGKWSEAYLERVKTLLNGNILNTLGKVPITKITAPMVLERIHAIEARGALEQAARALRWTKTAFRYGVATGRLDRSPLAELKGSDVLTGRTTRGYAHLELKQVGPFLRALTEYSGKLETQIAVQLLLLTAVRTGELRFAEWDEFDFAKLEWRIPASRMKMGTEHIVPLSAQVVALLQELRKLTGHSQYLFPGTRNPRKPISENTINKAISILGFKGKVVGHGFRATFSTIANESGEFSPDVIERQLAHKERNAIRAAYHRSTYLADRKVLMQWWADTLDKEHRSSI